MNVYMKSVALAAYVFCTVPFAMAQGVSTSPASTQEIREAIKTHLPAPPAGFVWQLYKNAVFPKPGQWNEHEMATNTIGIPFTTYAASPDNFSATQQFETGFTVQIISGSQRIRSLEAKKMALAYLKPLLDAHKKEQVLMLEQSAQGDFERTFFRYLDAPPGLKPIIVHKFLLANNVTDSVHIFTFESPVETWDENWAKYGAPILSRVNLVPNVPAN